MIKRKISKDENKITNKISKTPKNKKSVVTKNEKSTSPSPTLEFQYIANKDHYDLVIEKIKSVKKLYGLELPI